jgi:hypothetical protein
LVRNIFLVKYKVINRFAVYSMFMNVRYLEKIIAINLINVS